MPRYAALYDSRAATRTGRMKRSPLTPSKEDMPRKTALLLVACMGLLAASAHAQNNMSLRDPAGTVGVQLLDIPADTIGLRYRMRVNACAGQAAKKIVFVGIRTVTPEAVRGGNGTLDFDVMTDWLEYEDDLGDAGWPEQGYLHQGQPSLWLRNIDYGGVGRLG